MRLQGKTALITAGTTGIGRASAVLFAREGAQIILTDWREDRHADVLAEIAAAGGEATFVQCDVSRRADNERLIATCLERYGKLDILFCNAGRFLPKLITECSDEEIDTIFAVNVKALIYASRAAIPHMLEQGKARSYLMPASGAWARRRGRPSIAPAKGRRCCWPAP